jgi:hypothetical protein
MSDPYIDDIHSLLNSKVQGLGLPVTINRKKDNSIIAYKMIYSSGLDITLTLD